MQSRQGELYHWMGAWHMESMRYGWDKIWGVGKGWDVCRDLLFSGYDVICWTWWDMIEDSEYMIRSEISVRGKCIEN